MAIDRLVPVAPLHVVKSVDGIEPALRAMLRERQPGFQIAPGVDPDVSLAELQRVMQLVVDPEFHFDDIHESVSDQGDAVPHIDGLARRGLGIARHFNESGFGSVALQLVKPKATGTLQLTERDFVGRCLGASLEPGTQTIFSEGVQMNVGRNAGKTVLGATLHDFTTVDRGLRRYRRDTWTGEESGIYWDRY